MQCAMVTHTHPTEDELHLMRKRNQFNSRFKRCFIVKRQHVVDGQSVCLPEQRGAMRRHPAAAVCLALLLVACCHCGEARVRLNAIRTVILREGHMLPANRSLWGPSLDLTVSCTSFHPRQATCPLPSHRPLTSCLLGTAVPVHERP